MQLRPQGPCSLGQGHAALYASAASDTSPPAGPEFRRTTTPLGPLARKALHFDKPLCASLDQFTLHAATRAGALDARAREALLNYVLRLPLAQDRVAEGPEGLVRLALKAAVCRWHRGDRSRSAWTMRWILRRAKKRNRGKERYRGTFRNVYFSDDIRTGGVRGSAIACIAVSRALELGYVQKLFGYDTPPTQLYTATLRYVF